jgi:hypothetical protein
VAKKFVLDKTIVQGTVYETGRRVAYVVRKVGTNSAGAANLKIDGKSLGFFDADVAPLHKTESNLNGPLDLKDEYYVIPPETKFEFEGDSGSKCRIIGEAVFLAVGEQIEAVLASRFKEQEKIYRTFYEGSFSLGVDEAWGADVAYEILSLTPLTTEKITLDDKVMVSITGGSFAEGDFALEFYLDDAPIELDVAENLMKGIDVLSAPYPPADTTEELVFTLKDFPIEVLGDHTLSIRVRNVSGAAESPAAGSAWSVKVKAVARYVRQ